MQIVSKSFPKSLNFYELFVTHVAKLPLHGRRTGRRAVFTAGLSSAQKGVFDSMIARRLVLALLLTAHAPDVSNAQNSQQQLLGQFQDWSAYAANGASGKVCFVISQPKSRAPEGLNRDPAYFYISHRPGESVRNEVYTIVGFPIRAGSVMDLSVNGAPFQLVTQDQRGWSNGADDTRIVEAMRSGSEMTVKSTSGRGNVTTDTYSLRGVSAALDAANGACR